MGAVSARSVIEFQDTDENKRRLKLFLERQEKEKLEAEKVA